MKAMKFWLLMAVMVVATGTRSQNDDPEMRHVRLTMMDGKRIREFTGLHLAARV